MKHAYIIGAAMLCTILDTPAAAIQAQTATDLATQTTLSPSISDQFVERDRLTVQIIGTGPDIILIPGLASPRDVWDLTAQALSENYRLHILQIRGFGDAPEANAEGPVLEPFVDDLAGYITENDLDHPAIIGHSMGGLSGMMLETRHPGLTSKLMIVDSLPFIGLMFDRSATVETMRPRAEAMRQMMASSTAPANAAMFATMSATAEGRAQVADWSNASDNGVVAQVFFDVMITDIRPQLGMITVPTTVLYPFDGSQGSAEETSALYIEAYNGMATVALEQVDGSRHFIMLDQPHTFLDEVQAFLSE